MSECPAWKSFCQQSDAALGPMQNMNLLCHMSKGTSTEHADHAGHTHDHADDHSSSEVLGSSLWAFLSLFFWFN